MRKSAKRFLSTILALTMLCSCMVVMNINTVFAADNSATFTNSYTADAGDKVDGFNDTDIVIKAAQNLSSNQPASNNYNFTISGSSSTTPGRPSFIFNAVQSGTLTVTHNALSASGQHVYIFKLVDGTFSLSSSTDDNGDTTYTVSGTYSIAADEEYDSEASNSEISADLEADCTYILASRGTSNRFTEITYTVSSGDSGDSSDTPSTATAVKFTVDEYAQENSITSLSSGDSNNNDSSVATSTKIYSGDTYTITTADKFYLYTVDESIDGYSSALVSATNGNSTSGTSVLTVNLNKGDTINIYFAGGESKYGNAKAITATISSENDAGASASSTTTYGVYTLSHIAAESATYTVANTGSSRFVLYAIEITPASSTETTQSNVITAEDGTVYLVAGLSTSEDIADYDYFYLADDSGDQVSGDATNNTVIYTGVEIDGTEYSASSFDYDYVYGFKISDYSSLSEEQIEALANYSLVLATAE